MPKLRDDAVTAEDIKEYLKSRDDFDLELFVYRTAKQLGFSVGHGGTYEDPVTNKHRQYDVRASIERRYLRVDLAIECKALRTSFPLVISCIPRATDEAFHHLILASTRELGPGEFATAMELRRARTIVVRDKDSVYRAGERVGKSTTQIGRYDKGEFASGDGEVFDKWSQALASADDLITDAADAHERHGVPMFLTAVLALLVVSDGTLWTANYSVDGVLERDPQQVNEATLFVGRTYSSAFNDSFTLSHLHVCTRSGVSAFLEGLKNQTTDIWDRLFPLGSIDRMKFL
jgi:hypothetical protein